MLKISRNTQVADRQMHAIIFYLTTFGYIDGEFDKRERNFIRDYIRKLVTERIRRGKPDADGKLKEELTNKFTQHFLEVFDEIDHHIGELFTEAVAQGEQQRDFVGSKLKLRCYEIFRSFDEQSQQDLLESANGLIKADGDAHPAELQFRDELLALLRHDGAALRDSVPPPGAERKSRPPVIEVSTIIQLPPQEADSFFDQFEHHYSRHPDKILKQVAADRALMDQALAKWAEQRAAGQGKLLGRQSVDDFAGDAPFFDGHVYVHPPAPTGSYDITVIGDLHGCYSNLKAAVAQSRFFEKLAAWRRDPSTAPEPKLVFLGDYIDRGLFSLNGVLRTALQLFVTEPDHVYVLRGNHEYYIEHNGEILGGVIPAEAINSLKPHVPMDFFRHYMQLFDAMPNMLLFGGILFVHGGIPRDSLLEKRWTDLSSLNDPDIRFQMMWSDPSSVEFIPPELQEQSARFPFGRLQAAAFLHRLGAHAIVRGHEKVANGFVQNYDSDDVRLFTVFSAGGANNQDVPADSVYRRTIPMALSVEVRPGALNFVPWPIDYEHYNVADRNQFMASPAEIEHLD